MFPWQERFLYERDCNLEFALLERRLMGMVLRGKAFSYNLTAVVVFFFFSYLHDFSAYGLGFQLVPVLPIFNERSERIDHTYFY
jgi:hypothetical protein